MLPRRSSSHPSEHDHAADKYNKAGSHSDEQEADESGKTGQNDRQSRTEARNQEGREGQRGEEGDETSTGNKAGCRRRKAEICLEPGQEKPVAYPRRAKADARGGDAGDR